MELGVQSNSLNQIKAVDFYEKILSRIPDLIFQMEVSANGVIQFPFLSNSFVAHFELNIDETKAETLVMLAKKMLPSNYLNFLLSFKFSTDEVKQFNHEFQYKLLKKGSQHFRLSATVEKVENGNFAIYGRVEEDTKNKIQTLKLKIAESNDKGKPSRIIGTNTNLTVQIEKEKELKQSIENLTEQNKRLSSFAHIITHNLRSHAGNFKMLLEIIKDEDDSEIIQESLNYMRTNAENLSETIENLQELVDFQTELKPIRKHINLKEYLQKIVDFLRMDFQKNNVEYSIDVPKDETVFYNPAYLESILLNFSTNAIKYSDSNKNAIVVYKFIVENGTKTLSITDNGLGIDLEKNGHLIFGMHKTFHKNENARGIGLFMTKNQIEAMGGNVTIESQEGKGTTFKIYFNE